MSVTFSSRREQDTSFLLNIHSTFESKKVKAEGTKVVRMLSWEDVKLIPSSGKTINSSKVGMCLEL
jgi:hypothetical protein